MAPTDPNLVSLVRLLPTVALFLLPGWLLGRCLPGPHRVVTTFLGAAAILFNSLLLLDALRIPFTTGSLALVSGLWSAGLGAFQYLRKPAAASAACLVTPTMDSPPVAWPWATLATLGFLSLVLRAILDPLSGWDNYFRWDYLAHLFLQQGSLAHYPATTSADFFAYSWCDGIPPLVPELNFLLYLGGNSTAAVMTAPRIVAEAILGGIVIYRLAGLLWGARAGWVALAIAASSPLMLWSCAMGQETGMLTLSLGSVVLLLEEFRRKTDLRLAGWAGIAAGVGAVSRDYGLALVLLGLATLAVRRSSWRALLSFGGAAVVVAGPWYLRNWCLTGNPVFPHAVGGLFPTNEIHTLMMQTIARHWGVFVGEFDPTDLPRLLLLLAGPLLLLGVVGAIRCWPRHRMSLFGLALFFLLWWVALPSTAGGWIYGGRVLAPGLALAGVLAAGALTRYPAARRGLLVVLTLLVIDASRRSWLLPTHLAESPWPYSWATWRNNRSRLEFQQREKTWDILIPAAQGRAIAVDLPPDHVRITRRGGHALTWFSPQFHAVFEPGLSFGAVRQELLRRGVRFITLTKDDIISQDFRQRNAFLRELTTRHEPAASVQGLDIYDLDLIGPSS